MSDDDQAFYDELWDARSRSRRAVRRVVRRLTKESERRELTKEERTRLRAFRQALDEQQS